MTQLLVSKGEYGEKEDSHCAKTCAFSNIPSLSPDDRQALETIINLWSELSPETKVAILQMIEAERLSKVK